MLTYAYLFQEHNNPEPIPINPQCATMLSRAASASAAAAAAAAAAASAAAPAALAAA